MRILEVNLETYLDNEQLQRRQANETIKELQEKLEDLMQTYPVYRI